MSTGRDWNEFNDAWRGNDLARRFGGWLGRTAKVLSWPLRHPVRVARILTWPFRHPHRTVKEIEPWGILLAVIGVLAFVLEYNERIEERTVRAWQLVTTKAPGNSGKIQALGYLAKRDGFWCDQIDCLITLKTPTPLIGIDLSSENAGRAVYLVNADLSGADLRRADLRGANSWLANLRQADLRRADLSGAALVMADLRGAKLTEADLSGAALVGANGLSQAQLDQACGDESTGLNNGLTIPLCTDVPWFNTIHGEDALR